MGPMFQYTNAILTLMAAHLLASILTAETRNLRAAVGFLVLQSATLAFIFGTFGYLLGQPWLYAWSATALATKVVLIPLMLLVYTRRFPGREIEPIIGFRLSLFLIIVLMVVLYEVFDTGMDFIAPTEAARLEPARSSLAMAFTVFTLGVYVCIVRRDVVKIVIGIVLMENGVHLSLVTLAPGLPETTVIGITSNIVVAVWLLLVLSGQIYLALGTKDTATLSTLRR